ncbi:alpha/beta hydrolase [Limobrevibacterium gyesilva]|uniref:Alpha/beta hydrolase n=1 Tax=Limobrevibacterium gyesilva TaxID=2991712 RepID=A0AA42CHP3_9PROT|nr:alpha/beta hydrolase [Limobrevibacterium gyesilva]MCW3475187.1 alpha/beta hydrolase [Limobrevibacterium gyesilva]
MPNILFATNRQRLLDSAAGLPDFGDETLPASAGALSCATATVTDITLAAPASGDIVAISPLNQDGFADKDLEPVLRSQNDILVFVHGAANSFTDAIKRAAYNKSWMGAATVPGASSVFDVIAFTWPARPYVLADIIGDYSDYRHDQAQARQSAFHFGLFLRELQALQQRIGTRRLHLLCHSMGNYMLGSAVEAWFAANPQPGPPLFDEIVLAAADESASTFSAPNGGRLSNLWRLGREITVYYNNNDVAMALSHVVNRDFRLGYDGPPDKADTRFYSPNVYEFVDCTGVNDLISGVLDSPDRSHQYYRQSPTVRADIVATLAGQTPTRLRYDANANAYSLFPAPVIVAARGGADAPDHQPV